MSTAEYQHKYYASNRTKIVQRTTDYQKAHPIKRLLIAARYRAKLVGVAFDLKEQDIEIPEMCPVLGLRLQWGLRNSDNSPSLDRVVPSKGYIKGNTNVISRRANTLKRDATHQELRKVYEYTKAQCQS